MKQTLVILAVIGLACCSSIPKGGAPSQATPQAPSQAQAAAPALAGDSFTGTIVGHRMGGSMAKPYLRAQIKGDDGQVVEFNLRKTTAVTDPDGKTIGFLKRYKNGLRVEIKFTVKDGKNEALAWHYLD
ncbi:MAG TPA: hypothetical protein VKT17_11185 [Acidobacteriota bacterium]|nr:hypothetical protein [Acidobacteriota bacterium]